MTGVRRTSGTSSSRVTKPNGGLQAKTRDPRAPRKAAIPKPAAMRPQARRNAAGRQSATTARSRGMLSLVQSEVQSSTSNYTTAAAAAAAAPAPAPAHGEIGNPWALPRLGLTDEQYQAISSDEEYAEREAWLRANLAKFAEQQRMRRRIIAARIEIAEMERAMEAERWQREAGRMMREEEVEEEEENGHGENQDVEMEESDDDDDDDDNDMSDDDDDDTDEKKDVEMEEEEEDGDSSDDSADYMEIDRELRRVTRNTPDSDDEMEWVRWYHNGLA